MHVYSPLDCAVISRASIANAGKSASLPSMGRCSVIGIKPSQSCISYRAARGFLRCNGISVDLPEKETRIHADALLERKMYNFNTILS